MRNEIRTRIHRGDFFFKKISDGSPEALTLRLDSTDAQDVKIIRAVKIVICFIVSSVLLIPYNKSVKLKKTMITF
ncbi:hypothetical protein LEP1GSC170_3074 [Leptospira interrogans serovar Bataviae str. HAI135]|nr:hypothetical protein LEP1GSC170_3074 [Leptospira interrogans serovar Bataviae str. HAI135]